MPCRRRSCRPERSTERDAIDPEITDKQSRWFREAARARIALNAACRGKLQRKRRALAARMLARRDDYLRFAHDLRVPFDNNQAEQVIRMRRLRIKVSGCIRSMAGAEAFCAIRSYLATAARHGIGALDALTRAAQGNSGSPSCPDGRTLPDIPLTGADLNGAEYPDRYPHSVNRFCASLLLLLVRLGGAARLPIIMA